MAGAPLRLVHGLIESELPASRLAQTVEHDVEGLVAVLRMEERGDGNRSGVDHRVVRPVRLGLQADRVEGISARFDADVAGDLVVPELFERQPEHQRLGDRLEREGVPGVANLEEAARGGGQGNRKQLRIRSSELRDVCGDLALGQRLIAAVRVIDSGVQLVFVHRRFGRSPSSSVSKAYA